MSAANPAVRMVLLMESPNDLLRRVQAELLQAKSTLLDQGCGGLAEFLGVEGDWLTKSAEFEFVSVPFPQAPPWRLRIELFATC